MGRCLDYQTLSRGVYLAPPGRVGTKGLGMGPLLHSEETLRPSHRSGRGSLPTRPLHERAAPASWVEALAGPSGLETMRQPLPPSWSPASPCELPLRSSTRPRPDQEGGPPHPPGPEAWR